MGTICFVITLNYLENVKVQDATQSLNQTKKAVSGWSKKCVAIYTLLLISFFLPVASVWGQSISMHSLLGESIYVLAFYALVVGAIAINLINVPHNIRRLAGALVVGVFAVTCTSTILELVEGIDAVMELSGGFGGRQSQQSLASLILEQVSIGLPVMLVAFFLTLPIPFKSEGEVK
ncbi:hypothetical protein [Vibrio crassostreae]|uniref:hypothetical protein n=1 Tax=Vibrio crassostreae TaxID=246167 RepID=UPI001B30BC28|nr:hypothetical protein [Vibrio crassostreae]